MTPSVAAIAARYVRCADAFGAKVAHVRDGDWARPTPCSDWTVRDLVGHVCANPGLFLTLVGAPAPDLPPVSDDPLATWRAADAAVRAALADPELAARTYLGYFGPTTFAASVDGFLVFDLVVHGWDLARATAQDARLPGDELATLERAVDAFGDTLYGPGVCGPALTPPPGADAQTRLLARLGRRA